MTKSMGVNTAFLTLLYDYMDGDWAKYRLDILVSFSNLIMHVWYFRPKTIYRVLSAHLTE